MCCLFGLVDYKHHLSAKDKSTLISTLAAVCESRGTDATGIAYNYRNHLQIYKRPIPGHRMHLSIPSGVNTIMGHTRMTTQGSAKRNRNNHPFPGRASGQPFALAHNGVIYNEDQIRKNLSLPRTKIETDSYVAVQIIEQENKVSFDSLSHMAEQIDGSFCFTILDSHDCLYFVKGSNPLCIYHYLKAGVYVYASTEQLLYKALNFVGLISETPQANFLRSGEILRIDPDGEQTYAEFQFEPLPWNEWNSWGGNWVYPDSCGHSLISDYEREYRDSLLSTAAFYGYEPKELEDLLEDGYTLDDVKELIYAGKPY